MQASKKNSWQIFDRIYAQYDFLNHLLSFGFDVYWRRRLSLLFPPSPHQRILDLATGTADVPIALVRHMPCVEVIGIDLSGNMLELAERKISRRGLNSKIQLTKGDIRHVPFNQAIFDGTTIAFGIRNVPDPSDVLAEMHRVLKADGQTCILEFSLPSHPVLKFFYLSYLRSIVPWVGGIISGNFSAYRYLNSTIEQFPCGEDFCRLMRNVGFVDVDVYPLLFGIASIYKGKKPA